MLDIADLGGQGALVIVDDAAGHVVRQQAVIGPNDAYDWDVDVRKYIRRRLIRRTPNSAMTTASTTKVYGRLSAVRTIHTANHS